MISIYKRYIFGLFKKDLEGINEMKIIYYGKR